MNLSPLLSFVVILAIPALAAANVTVNFSNSQVASTVTLAGSAETSGSGTNTLTSLLAVDLQTPIVSGNADYSGPNLYGGAYRQTVYSTAQTAGLTNWLQLRSDPGFTAAAMATPPIGCPEQSEHSPLRDGPSGKLRCYIECEFLTQWKQFSQRCHQCIPSC